MNKAEIQARHDRNAATSYNSWSPKQAFQDLAALLQDNTALREQLEAANKRIADAPHEDDCSVHMTPAANPLCNCWKSKDTDK